MNKKIVFSLLALLLSVTILSGCGIGGSSQKTVEIIAKGFQHDFWKAVKKGADEAGKKHGVKINFVGPEGEGAIAAQVEMINNAINKNSIIATSCIRNQSISIFAGICNG